MIFIETLAKQLLPELKNEELSTVCLSTSNPVYLIFTKNKTYPEAVIRLAESDNISHPHNVLLMLHKELGDLVPEPLLLTKHKKKFISIQRGLEGSPWFQLASKKNFITQWDQLRLGAIDSLNKFSHAVKSNKDWQETCKPGRQLRYCYEQCILAGTPLPDKTEALVTSLSNELMSLGEITAYPQHGDFCLNNLIIDKQIMRIIDFEDFGITSMPLHDQFTLALSLFQLAPATAASTLAQELNSCIKDEASTDTYSATVLSGLFLHHILLRLGSWSQNRAPYRKWLISILDEFIEAGDSFFLQDLH